MMDFKSTPKERVLSLSVTQASLSKAKQRNNNYCLKRGGTQEGVSISAESLIF